MDFTKLKEFLRRSEPYVGFFNNTLSPRYNIVYFLFLVLCRLRSRKVSLLRAVSPRLFFPPEDYVVVPKVMRRDYALGLSSKMSSIEQNFPSEIVAFKGYHHQVTSPLANLGTSLESLLGNKNFVDMVERIIGSHFQVVWIDCYRTKVKANAELDQSWLWHSDNTPVGTLKCMIALTDISGKNGAMAYLNRKNSSRVRKLKYFGDDSQKRNTSVDTLIDNESYLLANAGDVLLFDNNNLHKANVPSSGYRDVMTCLLMPRLVRSSAREKMDNSCLKVDQFPGGFPSNPFLVSSSGFKLNEGS